MRFIHDCLGKLDMQAAGVMVTELTLMFQYIACKLNKIPFGIRNINTYSEEKVETIRDSSELVMFICPADWTMFQVPSGIEFTSLKNNRGEAVKSTIEKLEIMKEFRENELLSILNKQYSGMHLKEPRKLETNSVVLLRNIANESKREPMKFARVLKINESKDNAQRILTLTYNNIKKRKDGSWIGIPKIVERSINDVIPIDNAVNESMLNPSILEKVVTNEIDDSDEGVLVTENGEAKVGDEADDGDEIEMIQEGSNEITMNNDEVEVENEKNDNSETEGHKQIRRSERIKKRRVEINPDDIGEDDNENDEDYK